MELFGHLAQGFVAAATPMNLLMCLLGVVLGQIIGVLPGIGPSAAIALLLPLTYGASPTAAILARLYFEKAPHKDEEPVGKAFVVLAALAASVVGLDLIGFAPSIFLLLLVLFAAVERLPIVRSFAVAAAVTAVLFLIFRTWLRVPLPVGPLGI